MVVPIFNIWADYFDVYCKVGKDKNCTLLNPKLRWVEKMKIKRSIAFLNNKEKLFLHPMNLIVVFFVL